MNRFNLPPGSNAYTIVIQTADGSLFWPLPDGTVEACYSDYAGTRLGQPQLILRLVALWRVKHSQILHSQKRL